MTSRGRKMLESDPVVTVTWPSGLQATVASFDGERVTLRSAASFAPGTPVTGTLLEPPGLSLSVKVHGCRRDGDAFVVVGRLVNPTRELRSALAGPPPSDG